MKAAVLLAFTLRPEISATFPSTAAERNTCDDLVSLMQVKQGQVHTGKSASSGVPSRRALRQGEANDLIEPLQLNELSTMEQRKHLERLMNSASEKGFVHHSVLAALRSSGPPKRNSLGVPEDDGSPCVPADDGLTSCDKDGHPCMLCGSPLPGRGYDGKVHYSSEIRSEADLRKLPKGDFILRDDCGDVKGALEFGERFSDHVHKLGEPQRYPNSMNAWCDLNMQVVSANAFANKDLLFHGKTVQFDHPMQFDFNYCKKNGWLSRETREAIAGGYESGRRHAQKFCAQKAKEFNLTDMAWGTFMWSYFPLVMRDPPIPNKEEASFLGAWPCAMGGTDGLKGADSDGPASTMGFCTYTFGDLGNGDFCQYDECDGWDPINGMPVADLAIRKSSL